MSTYEFNGVTYDDADLTGASGRGYADIVTTGTGLSTPRYIAPMVDALADIGEALTTTSTTSLTVGVGSKTLTMAAARPFSVGAWVTITRTSNVDTYMFGQVTARSGTSLTVDVSFTAGSGTHTDWTVQISGPRGATGALANVVDDLTPQLGGTLDGQSNDVQSITLKAVDDYYELIFGTLLSGEGDYDLTFSSDEAKTLTDFEVGSTTGGFTGTVKVAGADAGVSAVCSSSTASDNTFTDASVAVGESLAVNVASITGSPTGCWARLHFRTDRVVNS